MPGEGHVNLGGRYLELEEERHEDEWGELR